MTHCQNVTKPLFPRQKRGKSHGVVTAARKKAFVDALAVSGMISDAAYAAGISRNCAYNQRKADSDFATAWDDALERFADSLEKEAHRRAVEGWEEPVFQGGQEVGRVRKYSDRLLADMLKARRESYRSPKTSVSILAQPAPESFPPVFIDADGNLTQGENGASN